MKTKLFILIAILSFWPLSVYAENLTITTYYPSPSGSYKDLSISNKVSFTTASAEDTPSINSSTVGTVTQLNILSGGDSDDSIYLGGDGSTTQGGRNGSTTGTIYLWADNIVMPPGVTFGICNRINYNPNSGTQSCPAGTSMASPSVALLNTSGSFLCCKCNGC